KSSILWPALAKRLGHGRPLDSWSDGARQSHARPRWLRAGLAAAVVLVALTAAWSVGASGSRLGAPKWLRITIARASRPPRPALPGQEIAATADSDRSRPTANASRTRTATAVPVRYDTETGRAADAAAQQVRPSY